MKATKPERFCEFTCNASGDSFLGHIKCGVNNVASVSQFILLLLSKLAVLFSRLMMCFNKIRFGVGSKSRRSCNTRNKRFSFDSESLLLTNSENYIFGLIINVSLNSSVIIIISLLILKKNCFNSKFRNMFNRFLIWFYFNVNSIHTCNLTVGRIMKVC